MSKEIEALVDQWKKSRRTVSKEMEMILDRWTNVEEIRLHAGEIDSETMRTVLAVTNAMARQIRAVLEKEQG